jgi:hypothetical protein
MPLALGLPLFGQGVAVRDGNVYYTDEQKQTRRLTSDGADSDPSLSPDGTTVIFVHRTAIPAGFTEPTNLHPVRNQICLIDAAGRGGLKVVFDAAITVDDHRYATFSDPHLAPDNRHAYFLIHLAVVEFGLVKLNLGDGQVQMISPALDWHVIASGRYAGDLLVQRRKQTVNGIYVAYWLLSEDGSLLGLVGQSEREALAFLKNPDRKIR